MRLRRRQLAPVRGRSGSCRVHPRTSRTASPAKPRRDEFLGGLADREYRSVKPLDHDGRRRTVGRVLRQAGRQGCAGAASRNGQPARVDIQFGALAAVHVSTPARHRARRDGVLGSQPIVHRDERAAASPRKFHTLAVIGVQVAQHESACVAIDDRRSRRRAASVNPHRDRTTRFRFNLVIVDLDTGGVDGRDRFSPSQVQ